VATIRGEVDLSNADRLLDELIARVGATPWLVVDLGGCSYLDSAGLRVIARVDLRCRDVGAGLRLVVDRGSSIDRVLAMTHMDEVMTVDRQLRDALVAALEDVDGLSATPGADRLRELSLSGVGTLSERDLLQLAPRPKRETLAIGCPKWSGGVSIGKLIEGYHHAFLYALNTSVLVA
jgi:stage II sporulation protein AA (anti-sigma F factor antagonist)